jgi:diguanylate cyclase (GGDEF)-like protein
MATGNSELRMIDISTIDRTSRSDDGEMAKIDRELAAAHLDRVYRDDLTGALTRRPGREALEREIARSRRGEAPLTLAFVDVNGLKSVNDHFGHARGDDLLQAVGSALTNNVRPYDLVIRYGGDEFVCGFPESARREARACMLRVLSELALHEPTASLSVGYAELEQDDTLNRLISRADADMYRARRRAAHSKGRRGPLPVMLCQACDRILDISDAAEGAPAPSVNFVFSSHVATCASCLHATLILAAPQGSRDAVALPDRNRET